MYKKIPNPLSDKGLEKFPNLTSIKHKIPEFFPNDIEN